MNNKFHVKHQEMFQGEQCTAYISALVKKWVTELVCGLFSVVEEVEEGSFIILCLFSAQEGKWRSLVLELIILLVQTSMRQECLEAFWTKPGLAAVRIYTN